MVQTQLSKGILFGRILSGRLAGRLDLIHADRNAKRWVGFLPHLDIRPVVGILGTVYHRIEGSINLPACDNIQCLLVCFITDGMGIRSGSRNKKVQRLRPGITGAFGHDIKQLPVRLRVQLVEDHAAYVKTMLAIGISREHLVKAVRGKVDDPLLRSQELHPLGQGRTHPHHIRRHFKDNRCLLAVGGTAIHLSTLFPVTAAQEECYRCRQFRFALFLGNLDVGGIKLPIAVRL